MNKSATFIEENFAHRPRAYSQNYAETTATSRVAYFR